MSEIKSVSYEELKEYFLEIIPNIPFDYLANGKYTANLKKLDISLPADCGENTKTYGYFHRCNSGIIYNDASDNKIYFLVPDQTIAYVHFVEDNYASAFDYTFKAGSRSCHARPANKLAQDVCINMGGKYVGESKAWKYYPIDDSN